MSTSKKKQPKRGASGGQSAKSGAKKTVRRRTRKRNYPNKNKPTIRDISDPQSRRYWPENGTLVIDVRTPPLWGRMPPKLSNSYRLPLPRGYQESYDEAFEKVQNNWWDVVLPALAERYLSPAFGDVWSLNQIGSSGGRLKVSGLGSPSEWAAAQKSAWAHFVQAIGVSMLAAEQDYHKEVGRLFESRGLGKGRRSPR